MSEDLQKQLAAALNRIAQMEERLAAKPAPASTPSPNAPDPTADPVGFLVAKGVPFEHAMSHFLAQALGENAPPHIKEYVRGSKQMGATAASLETKLEAIGRRLDEVTSGTRAERFKALAADTSKYPHLARAYAADPSLFDGEVGSGNDVAEIAQKAETRLAKLAPALGAPPAASAAQAAVSIAQGQNAKPAPTADALQGTPPPIQQPKPGAVTPDVYAQLKAEVVKAHEQKNPG